MLNYCQNTEPTNNNVYEFKLLILHKLITSIYFGEYII